MIVLTEPDRGLRQAIRRDLSDTSVVESEGRKELSRLLATRAEELEVVLLGPGLTSQDAMDASSEIQRTAPEISVIVITKDFEPESLREALRSGVKDVLPAPPTRQQLVEAVDRGMTLARALRNRGAREAVGHAKGRVITVFSAKGGCGKSFLSANLAVMLARSAGRDVAAVDLDLQSGDLGIMFRLDPRYSIQDAAERADSLDAEGLDGYLTRHPSGVCLLAAPMEPEMAERISADAVETIVDLLRDTYPYVVIDGPSFFSDQLLKATDISDACVLMTSMDVPSIKNVKVSLGTLSALGIERERLWLVLNRADSKVGLHLKEVEEALGTRIDVSIPSSRDVPLSINQGVPLAMARSNSNVAEAVGTLAGLVGARSSMGVRRKLFARSA